MPMPESADLYEILQVHPAAQSEVIEAAYLRLAELNDPAHSPASDAVARLAEINGAYGILSDPQRRADYDAQRTGAVAGNGSELAGDAVVHDVVRAKSFQLVDDDGRTRAEMSLDFAGDPTLFMNDRDGNRRFAIAQRNDGSQHLTFSDQNSNWRLFVGEAVDGTPLLYMTDNVGNPRFSIQQDDDIQILQFSDQDDNVRLFVG